MSRVGKITLIFRSDHPINQRSASDDLIVDRIDMFQFALKFPINSRHLLRRKYKKFCVSKNGFMGAKGFLLPKCSR